MGRGRLSTGTRHELGDLYREEGQRLWRAVFAYAQDREVASDAVAEAFAQCIRRGDAVLDPRAWVWRAAFRIAAGELKERGRDVPAAVEGSYEMPEDTGRLLAALRALPPNQRAAMTLRHYAGYPTSEVAAMLGCSAATVRVHLSRARRRLRGMLEEQRP
jgi:RNA polymerase sigma-70 factor (ECF subfamily)